MPFLPVAGAGAAAALAAGCLSLWRRTRRRRFLDGFLWGTATAAYQVEGAAAEGGRTPSTWDAFSHIPGKIRNGDTGDVACMFYHKYKEDVTLAAEACGANAAFRMSISWSRVFPERRALNQQGLEFYVDVVDQLVRKNVSPVVTLFHWDTPQWAEDYGGWRNRQIVGDFRDFAEAVFTALGTRVKLWVTINEPWITSTFAYGTGIFAPGVEDSDGTVSYLVTHHQLLAHCLACQLYRSMDQSQGGRIGIALNCMYRHPANPSSRSDVEAAERANIFEVGWFADPLYFGDYPEVMKARVGPRIPEFTPEEKQLLALGRPDFFGLNHYSSRLCTPSPGYPQDRQDANAPSYFSDVGVQDSDIHRAPKADPEWLHVVPWGFRNLLVWIHRRYKGPEIIVTENGCAAPGEACWPQESDLQDVFRQRQITGYINAMWEAIHHHGVCVIGYTYWSLLDNFEWLDGFNFRFGLVRVDFNSESKAREILTTTPHPHSSLPAAISFVFIRHNPSGHNREAAKGLIPSLPQDNDVQLCGAEAK